MNDEHEDVFCDWVRQQNTCDWKFCVVMIYLVLVHPFLMALLAVWVLG